MKKINELKVQEILQTEKVKKQKGATMVEYALVVAAVAAIAALVFAGNTTSGIGKVINDNVQKAAPTT